MTVVKSLLQAEIMASLGLFEFVELGVVCRSPCPTI